MLAEALCYQQENTYAHVLHLLQGSCLSCPVKSTQCWFKQAVPSYTSKPFPVQTGPQS